MNRPYILTTFGLRTRYSLRAGQEVRSPRTAPGISRGFIAENPTMLLLIAQVAEMFGQWPSELLKMAPMDFQFNFAAAVMLWQWRNEVNNEVDSRQSR